MSMTSTFHVGIHPGELDWTCLSWKNSFCLAGSWRGPTCLPHASPPQDFHLAVWETGLWESWFALRKGPWPPSGAGGTGPSYPTSQWHSSRGAWPRKPGRAEPTGSGGQSPAIYNPFSPPCHCSWLKSDRWGIGLPLEDLVCQNSSL